MANRLGITDNISPVPSLALGTEEISVIDMVCAYASFANMGYKVNSHLIKRVEDSKGNILYEYKDTKVNILNESLVYILNEMLTYTYDTSFIDYNYPTLISLLPKMTNRYSIKSGTTDTDMWIIGYNKDAVLGVWAGYDNNKVLNGGLQQIHKNIWIDAMEGYLEEKDTSWYDIPNNVVGVLINPITGKISTAEDKVSKMFYFLKGTEPYIDDSYDFDSVFKEDDTVIEEEIENDESILDETIDESSIE